MNDKLSKFDESNATVIGKSIAIVGDITGQENIIINGSVEGDISFRENDILVGESGRINANVEANNISVEGDVKGELRATGQVVLKPSGRVNGDIKAPRVVLDDGCQFRGSIDMDEKISSDNRNSKIQLASAKGSTAHPLKSGKSPKSK
jgi:cytoskeletal protein CcmA (bactofilin family)